MTTQSPRSLAEEALRDDAKATSELIERDPTQDQLVKFGDVLALRFAVEYAPAMSGQINLSEKEIRQYAKFQLEAMQSEIDTRRTREPLLAKSLLRALDECAEMRKALKSAGNMLGAVAGDIEDGYSLADLRGKYVMALIDARVAARTALSLSPGEERCEACEGAGYSCNQEMCSACNGTGLSPTPSRDGSERA